MKKITCILIILVMMIPAAASAGEIGSIIATDVLIGSVAGAAVGAGLSIPSFLEGNGTKPQVLLQGAGIGLLIGAGLGFGYSIYNIIYFINVKEEGVRQRAELNKKDFYIAVDPLNMQVQLTKNF